jgi:hypothetical protein
MPSRPSIIASIVTSSIWKPLNVTVRSHRFQERQWRVDYRSCCGNTDHDAPQPLVLKKGKRNGEAQTEAPRHVAGASGS